VKERRDLVQGRELETQRQAVRSEDVEWNGRGCGSRFVVKEDGHEGRLDFGGSGRSRDRGMPVEMLLDELLDGRDTATEDAGGLGEGFTVMEDEVGSSATQIRFGRSHGTGC